ncbi:AAA family ATPase [Flavobacterium tructae]|uniref:AAA family ATPase n=1 Tax=Flavobacterium tructae TaxID=1114873 RepID=UPI0035A89B93
MIDFYHNYRSVGVPLVIHEKLIPEKNIFSILVGKNGTGKSTFLGNLTTDIIKEISRRKKKNEIINGLDFYDSSSSGLPLEVISVSTSPFDKFPITSRSNKQKNYTYLGLRDINSTSFGLGYLSKIIGSLIESIFKNPKQASEICNVLEYLGYRDEINIILDYNITPRQLELLFSSNNIVEEFDNRTNLLFRRLNRQFFTNADNSLNERKLGKLIRILQHIFETGFHYKNYNLLINRYGFNIVQNEISDVDNLIFLFEAGIIKLKDVLLSSIKDEQTFSIKDASSGEQSIILSILGIASKIKNDCLILIDEPEICLHPQWQETYIDILTNTFDKYKNCQFIIATHSPLIISRLSFYNSFIIDMESKEINSSDLFIDNSVDFQLANVFNFPGFKNEYLLRIAMSTFSNISKNKKFNLKDLEHFETLKDQSKYLNTQDPVFDLYKTLVELKEIYG